MRRMFAVLLMLVGFNASAAETLSVDDLTTESLGRAQAFSDTLSQSPTVFWTEFRDVATSTTWTLREQRDCLDTVTGWLMNTRLPLLEAWAGTTGSMREMLMATVDRVTRNDLAALEVTRVNLELRRARVRYKLHL